LPLAVSQTAYNANNQLTTWGTANLFYDLNGNMTSSGTDGFTWDARNRMVSTLSGASFQYDAFRRRTSKTIGGTTTSFLYDGANAVQEVIGGTNTANSLSGGVDELFQRTDSAGARNFLTDALGSTLALTDSSGTVQTSYTFEPFGNTTASGSASTNSFAYTGRELDAGNLYFYRARYYNPQLQRFISEDPIRLAGGDINLYAYAGSSPTNLFDALGLQSSSGLNGAVKQLQNIFPGSTITTDGQGRPVLTIPQDPETVANTLIAQGYCQGIACWAWDPIFHAGGEEYRTGGLNSLHFRKPYPTCPYGEDVCLKLPPQMQFPGRKTVLDQFHFDNPNPMVDPIGHIPDFLRGLGIDPTPSCNDPGICPQSPDSLPLPFHQP